VPSVEECKQRAPLPHTDASMTQRACARRPGGSPNRPHLISYLSVSDGRISTARPSIIERTTSRCDCPSHAAAIPLLPAQNATACASRSVRIRSSVVSRYGVMIRRSARAHLVVLSAAMRRPERPRHPRHGSGRSIDTYSRRARSSP